MATNTEWTEVESSGQPEGQTGVDLFAAIWRRKWIVFFVTFLAVALGVLYFFEATPRYKSSAQILLIKKEAKLPIGGMDAQLGYEDTLSTQLLLVVSPLVVGNAVEKHHLESLTSLKSREEGASPLVTIRAGLEAKQAGDRQFSDPNVISLSYEGTDPEDAAIVMSAVIDSYQDFLGGTYQGFSEETVQLITRAKDELLEQLNDAESAYRRFRQESPLLWTGEEGVSLHDARMAEIEHARSQVMVENAHLKARIEAIETAIKSGGKQAALVLLIENYGTEQSDETRWGPRNVFEQKLFEGLLEEQALLQDYGPDHPKVAAVRMKMELMRQHLGTFPGQEDGGPIDFMAVYTDSLREELAMGENQLEKYNELFEQESDAAKAQATFRLEDETYRDKIERTEKLFTSVLGRLEEMNLVKDYGGISTQLISAPGLGEQVYPLLLIVLAISGTLGLTAGFGLAYLAELADKRFRGPDDIQQQLGLPIVGHIPVINVHREKHGSGDKTALDPVLCTFHRPKSRQAEAYRAVRTALYFSVRAKGYKVIQVSSPNPADGKTTLAANLAVSIAQSGKKVLLLDGDCRRPKIHKYFSLDNSTGLSSLITQDAEISDVFQECGVENLQVITSGPHSQNAADMVTSSRFKELIDVVREKFDFVIIDSPPLLSVTDPASIAPRVDAVLLAMRLSKAARHATLRAVGVLDALGSEILGVVVNGIGKGAGYGYGTYRYGTYRYGTYRYAYRYGGYGNGHGSIYEGDNGNGKNSYYSDDKSNDNSLPKSRGKTDG